MNIEDIVNLTIIVCYIVTVVKVARALHGWTDGEVPQLLALMLAICVSVLWPLIWISAALRPLVFRRRHT